jgi:acyl-CoA reductase-like NAD-dependent aldehyde dehydrogenase
VESRYREKGRTMPEKNGRLSVINPATGKTLEEVPVSSREDVGAVM